MRRREAPKARISQLGCTDCGGKELSEGEDSKEGYSGGWWRKWKSQVEVQFSSVHSVVSDSLRPHGWQHARLLCPSLSSGVY